MDHAIYVSVPSGDDPARIAEAATALAPQEFDFAILEHESTAEGDHAELALRISGAQSVEEAIAAALRIYALSREAAQLPPDEHPRASAAVWPASLE